MSHLPTCITKSLHARQQDAGVGEHGRYGTSQGCGNATVLFNVVSMVKETGERGGGGRLSLRRLGGSRGSVDASLLVVQLLVQLDVIMYLAGIGVSGQPEQCWPGPEPALLCTYHCGPWFLSRSWSSSDYNKLGGFRQD